jgi:hypothetical protein
MGAVLAELAGKRQQQALAVVQAGFMAAVALAVPAMTMAALAVQVAREGVVSQWFPMPRLKSQSLRLWGADEYDLECPN